jgi:hypothetical protein
MDFDRVVDSGTRQHFETGSVRDTQIGKGRYDLLPITALHRVARHFENGAVKYGDHNWRLGQPYMRYFNSAIRHMFKWAVGCKDEDHLAAAAWNILALIDTEQRVEWGDLSSDLDDRHPSTMKGKAVFGEKEK